MLNQFKTFGDFINEDVNSEIVEAKLKITELKEKIAVEVNNQKDADSIEEKAKAIDAEANLYQQMPALLKDLASKMRAKVQSGDESNIY